MTSQEPFSTMVSKCNHLLDNEGKVLHKALEQFITKCVSLYQNVSFCKRLLYYKTKWQSYHILDFYCIMSRYYIMRPNSPASSSQTGSELCFPRLLKDQLEKKKSTITRQKLWFLNYSTMISSWFPWLIICSLGEHCILVPSSSWPLKHMAEAKRF